MNSHEQQHDRALMQWIQRSIAVGCGLLLLPTLLAYSICVRARLVLGFWPDSGKNPATEMSFGGHLTAIKWSLYVAPVALLLLLAAATYIWAVSKRPPWRSIVAIVSTFVVTYVLNWADFLGANTWLMD